MPQGRIRVKLKAYDHRLIDEAANKILEAALATGAKVIGPVPLPTKRKLVTVTTSPHVDKNAREQFGMLTHKRLIEVVEPTNRTIDALANMDLPAGVGVEVKM